MRTFIVSDLNGNENMYNIIMRYLENINKEDEITLYLNGNLVDSKINSVYMLIDIINRIEDNTSFNINYLGGNNEYNLYKKLVNKNMDDIPNRVVVLKNQIKILEFLSKLDIYHKFNTKINGKYIVLTHSKCPKNIKDVCDMKIGDNNKKIYSYISAKNNIYGILNENFGNKKYFTIAGNLPVFNEKGYKYYEKQNYLDIDGGCIKYMKGDFDYNHTPLIEIDNNNNKLVILTFNNQNEIILGNYFVDKINIRMNENVLNKYRKYIDKEEKVKIYYMKNRFCD